MLHKPGCVRICVSLCSCQRALKTDQIESKRCVNTLHFCVFILFQVLRTTTM